ncbi:GNAT family N-acetyltransferase [Paenibacillus silvae]|uniref:GNAT family N-acetyltransferase n=1 Tax=Paenibacillus silvae TaxID=1325358 RepID=UPI0020063061|nr:GNAT family N-acetyltransferase [Paenibacillus silvae]MCK6074565.1 GNAT family N-acetyltransferase [Paenibacillus silvae]MCK6147959.1 GNAT family N-acetyltransferase [Paenibacillus silvae]MCK6266257.1 GNAT family N-acetyltransferase [Paenibacillus silvae]
MSLANITPSTAEDSAYVRQQLIAYNAGHVDEALRDRYEELHFHIRNETGQIVAGVLSTLCWNWVELDILWVNANERHKGYGTQLLLEVERLAREKGCDFIMLNTFSYQAPEFYRKHGYQLMTMIENAPTGHQHYYFKKDLTPENRSGAEQ